MKVHEGDDDDDGVEFEPGYEAGRLVGWLVVRLVGAAVITSFEIQLCRRAQALARKTLQLWTCAGRTKGRGGPLRHCRPQPTNERRKGGRRAGTTGGAQVHSEPIVFLLYNNRFELLVLRSSPVARLRFHFCCFSRSQSLVIFLLLSASNSLTSPHSVSCRRTPKRFLIPAGPSAPSSQLFGSRSRAFDRGEDSCVLAFGRRECAPTGGSCSM